MIWLSTGVIAARRKTIISEELGITMEYQNNNGKYNVALPLLIRFTIPNTVTAMRKQSAIHTTP